MRAPSRQHRLTEEFAAFEISSSYRCLLLLCSVTTFLEKLQMFRANVKILVAVLGRTARPELCTSRLVTQKHLVGYITLVPHRHSTLAMARLLPLVAAAALLGPAASTITSRRECGEVEGDFYQFSAKTLNDSHTVAFEEYRGKVVMVVNVATY
ncbi:hypothetical protein O3P69_020102 [Scylla paramamosain]|uniref:Glutathione peroxidase n=1 Tax=Scylla paramamosain TaxID=85552 RepID=A0AAW0TNL8_SCYPA